MIDKIYDAFLMRQHEEGMTLSRSSELIQVFPVAPQAFVVRLRCKGLVQTGDGGIATADRFELGVLFPADYLRRANPMEVLTWFGPAEVFHPNIRVPFICIGHLAPATPLEEIVVRAARIVAYQVYSMHDSLNQAASSWARRNQHRFPVDSRPLGRKAPNLKFELLDKAKSQ